MTAAAPSWADTGEPRTVAIVRGRGHWVWRAPILLFLLLVVGVMAYVDLFLLQRYLSVLTIRSSDIIAPCAMTSVIVLFALIGVHGLLESMLRATLRLEGDVVSLSWGRGRRDEVLLDRSTVVEVTVLEESLTEPLVPDEIVGYTFEGPGGIVEADQERGFEHRDLMRILPDVLAAACLHHTRIGPNLKRIVDSGREGIRNLRYRTAPHERGGTALVPAGEG